MQIKSKQRREELNVRKVDSALSIIKTLSSSSFIEVKYNVDLADNLNRVRVYSLKSINEKMNRVCNRGRFGQINSVIGVKGKRTAIFVIKPLFNAGRVK